ncbi:MAG: cob(I)yrinic acid a,c-diamide adenosyltransferase [Elusimicrobia bacterium]|nr:cob(I)yrinic acid a,c-diamide adenosyltransferase [Elusimicrobiota bacterium]
MKIYTKVGDGGDTYLFGGRKLRKDSPRVKAYGVVDELNSVLGWAETETKALSVRRSISIIQEELFVLGADLSTPRDAPDSKKIPRIGPVQIERLEREMDTLSRHLPELRNFILPGGAGGGALLHLARAVCRRAERSLVVLLKRDQSFLHAQIYLNRLSDCLFLLARTGNQKARSPEKIWKPT